MYWIGSQYSGVIRDNDAGLGGMRETGFSIMLLKLCITPKKAPGMAVGGHDQNIKHG